MNREMCASACVFSRDLFYVIEFHDRWPRFTALNYTLNMSVIQVIVKNTNKHVCVVAFGYVCENTYLVFFPLSLMCCLSVRSSHFSVLCHLVFYLLCPPVHNPENQSQCTVLSQFLQLISMRDEVFQSSYEQEFPSV